MCNVVKALVNEIDSYEALEAILRDFPLPTESGDLRTASADEFMLMYHSPSLCHFKHIDSRNYLHMLRNGRGQWTISIPTTNEPFLRGTFDLNEGTEIPVDYVDGEWVSR